MFCVQTGPADQDAGEDNNDEDGASHVPHDLNYRHADAPRARCSLLTTLEVQRSGTARRLAQSVRHSTRAKVRVSAARH